MKRWFHQLLEYIWPRYCCICEQFLETDDLRYICENCVKKIIFPSKNICPKCGSDFGEIGAGAQPLCTRCLLTKFQFTALRSAVRLNGVSRKLMHQLKYKNGGYLAADFAKIIYKNLEFINFLKNSTLVPVPLHWARNFKREYNQSEILVMALRKLPIDVKVFHLLKRTRHTPQQVGLGTLERQYNVKNAFAVNQKINIPRDSKLIIFDDVFTTGATINECAKALRKHGFYNIYGATFAQTSKK
jgi:ComF family protein